MLYIIINFKGLLLDGILSGIVRENLLSLLGRVHAPSSHELIDRKLDIVWEKPGNHNGTGSGIDPPGLNYSVLCVQFSASVTFCVCVKVQSIQLAGFVYIPTDKIGYNIGIYSPEFLIGGVVPRIGIVSGTHTPLGIFFKVVCLRIKNVTNVACHHSVIFIGHACSSIIVVVIVIVIVAVVVGAV